MTEQEAFDHWLAKFAHSGARVTGWLIWCASLSYRGIDEAVAAQSRPAFDGWLAYQQRNPEDHNWTEFDAWCAAAWWARISYLI